MSDEILGQILEELRKISRKLDAVASRSDSSNHAGIQKNWTGNTGRPDTSIREEVQAKLTAARQEAESLRLASLKK